MSSIPMPPEQDEDALYERHRQKMCDEELFGTAGNEELREPLWSRLVYLVCLIAAAALSVACAASLVERFS